MIDMSQGEKNLSPIPKNVDWLKNNLENEDQVLEFLDDPNNQLEDQPTDVLIELAQKLKNRRCGDDRPTTKKCSEFRRSRIDKRLRPKRRPNK